MCILTELTLTNAHQQAIRNLPGTTTPLGEFKLPYETVLTSKNIDHCGAKRLSAPRIGQSTVLDWR